MYDVRCTIAIFARVARGGAELERAECDKAMRERSYKASGAGADGVCLCTRYDVRCTIWEFSARGAGGAELERAECDETMRGSG